MASRCCDILLANCLELSEIEFVLYGKAIALGHLMGIVHNYNQQVPIHVNLENANIQEMSCYFFLILFNSTLIIPEGVYQVEEFFHYDWQPERIEFPSTFMRFSEPQYRASFSNQSIDRKTTIVVYENIPDDCFKKLSHYLNPLASKIIIRGKGFTWSKKRHFKKLSPSRLPLKFVESNVYNEVYPLEEKIQIQFIKHQSMKLQKKLSRQFLLCQLIYNLK